MMTANTLPPIEPAEVRWSATLPTVEPWRSFCETLVSAFDTLAADVRERDPGVRAKYSFFWMSQYWADGGSFSFDGELTKHPHHPQVEVTAYLQRSQYDDPQSPFLFGCWLVIPTDINGECLVEMPVSVQPPGEVSKSWLLSQAQDAAQFMAKQVDQVLYLLSISEEWRLIDDGPMLEARPVGNLVEVPLMFESEAQRRMYRLKRAMQETLLMTEAELLEGKPGEVLLRQLPNIVDANPELWLKQFSRQVRRWSWWNVAPGEREPATVIVDALDDPCDLSALRWLIQVAATTPGVEK